MLAQLFQKSGLVLVSLKRSGIKSIKDLKNRVISSWGGIFIYPIMAMDGEHDLDLQHVYFGADVDKLQSGEVEVLTMMNYNEYFHLLEAGLKKEDLTVFPIAEFGYNIPEDGLYTNREFFQNQPEVCRNFKEATLRGWQLANEHREEALDLVMSHHKRSSLPTSRLHQESMLDEVLKLIGDTNQHNGKLNQEDFMKTVKVLNQIKLITQEIEIKDFYAG